MTEIATATKPTVMQAVLDAAETRRLQEANRQRQAPTENFEVAARMGFGIYDRTIRKPDTDEPIK